MKEGGGQGQDKHGAGGGVRACAQQDVAGEPARQQGGEKQGVGVDGVGVNEVESVSERYLRAVEAGQGGGSRGARDDGGSVVRAGWEGETGEQKGTRNNDESKVSEEGR